MDLRPPDFNGQVTRSEQNRSQLPPPAFSQKEAKSPKQQAVVDTTGKTPKRVSVQWIWVHYINIRLTYC